MLAGKLFSVSLVCLWCHAFTWSAATLHAQDATGALYGSVVDAVGQPLADVQITIVGTELTAISPGPSRPNCQAFVYHPIRS
jgi:hypothetical protein